MWVFGKLWDQWTIAFKVTTPMLHVLFAAAQLWGSWNFYRMYKKQGRIIEQKEVQADIEATVGGQDDPKIDGGATVSQSNGVVSRDGSEIELTEHPGP